MVVTKNRAKRALSNPPRTIVPPAVHLPYNNVPKLRAIERPPPHPQRKMTTTATMQTITITPFVLGRLVCYGNLTKRDKPHRTFLNKFKWTEQRVMVRFSLSIKTPTRATRRDSLHFGWNIPIPAFLCETF